MSRVRRAWALLVSAVLLSSSDDRKTLILIADAGHDRIVDMDDFSVGGFTASRFPRFHTGDRPVSTAFDSKRRIDAVDSAEDPRR